MMTVGDKALSPVEISDFDVEKQLRLFRSLKQLQLTGQLVLKDTRSQEWVLYIYMGRIVYATGGSHTVRRWKRSLAIHAPKVAASPISLQASTAPEEDSLAQCWEYQVLCQSVAQGKLSREEAGRVIRVIAIEVLCDIAQAKQVSYQVQSGTTLSTKLTLIDAEQAVVEAQKVWDAWCGAKVADRSPNSVPVIRHPQQLQEQTSPAIYQVLSRLLDGQQTLRDLSVKMKRDVVEVTCSLLPYIQLGLIDLVAIPDLPPPAMPRTPNPAKAVTGLRPLVACIDDSPFICQSMAKVLTQANYRFVAINDPMRAIAVLLARKPNLIFLDLVMPSTNGYEICSQLRKLSYFRDTPIVILTGHDGIVDRVRAKLVGASDFLSKPADAETVLSVIRKHLQEEAEPASVEMV
jgi:two-component system, chemotaxis family, response regulator PixG